MRYIGIDLGTTFIKGAVLNLDIHALEHIERLPFPEPLPGLPARHFEVDPEQVVAVTRALLERLLQHAPDCAGVLMSSQMHGVVLTDGTGAPLSNAITWRDERALTAHRAGGTYFDRVRERLREPMSAELGNELKPSRPACALFWLLEQGQLPQGATVAALPDFVITRLCNSPVRTEPTNASAHGLFNVWRGEWHHDIIDLLGLGGLVFPALASATTPVGELAIGGRRVPVRTAIGDQQAALLGAQLREGELSLNISTGSQASLLFRPQQPLTDTDVQVRPFFDDLLLKTITHIPAGRALNVLVALLAELAARAGTPLRDPWGLIGEALAEHGDDVRGLALDLSFFGGAGDAAAQAGGAIRHIREDNLDVATLFSAAFDDMARRYAEAVVRLHAAPGTPIAFSGGLALAFGPLRKRIARALNADFRLCVAPEDALSGLLHLAGR
jgi:sugar (pentulose or hexulose) kinase